MHDWLWYALLSVAQLSLLMALYKVPAAKQVNKYVLSVWSYFFATLGAALFLSSSIRLDTLTLVLAFLWGTGYAVLTLMQMHVLHLQDTSSVFPFTSVTSNILVVLGGVLLLHEHIAPMQWVAIVLAILLFFAFYWKNSIHFANSVLPLFLAISFLSTANKFVQKAGADHVAPYNFIFWQLVFALLASLVIAGYKKEMKKASVMHGSTLMWSFLSGALQFGSTYTIILALSLGPISLVYIILGLYTFFTSIIAALLFKEELGLRGLLFILLSFGIVLLIKFG